MAKEEEERRLRAYTKEKRRQVREEAFKVVGAQPGGLREPVARSDVSELRLQAGR